MGVAISIVVFAIGALLRFATEVHSTSFDLHTVGVIMMVAGVVGFVVSLAFWSSWGWFHQSRSSRIAYRQDDGTILEERRHTTF